MKEELIKFYANDGVILDGYINKCENKTNKILIEIHGMTSNCFKKREKIIANEVAKIGIDTLCFNNRGSEIVRYGCKKNGEKIIVGTAYENIEDCYYDIVGAIEYVISLGYTDIYLQGHSLGSTKIVYTYSKLKKENSNYISNIKGIILLSLVDIPDMLKTYTPKEYIQYAEIMEKENKKMELMPMKTTIHPLSVVTFLRYVKYNEDIDFARYNDETYEFKELNEMLIPIFMRWGNCKELIKKDAKEQVLFMKEKIKNIKADINYIDGANHSYDLREETLAKEIVEFLSKV